MYLIEIYPYQRHTLKKVLSKHNLGNKKGAKDNQKLFKLIVLLNETTI